MTIRRILLFALCLTLVGMACALPGRANTAALSELPVSFTSPPRRVVSLYPTATEVLAAIGAANLMVGISLHDTSLPGMEGKALVGGFAAPDVERILALKPDCVIATPLQAEVVKKLRCHGVPVLLLDTPSITAGEDNIRLLGALADKSSEAEKLITDQRGLLQLAVDKSSQLAKNSDHSPRRAIRLMGFAEGKLLVPGDDSFQNEFIRTAGAKPPCFGQKGQVIAVSPKQWEDFAPEVVYYCGHDPKTVQQHLSAPEWNSVPAVQEGRLLSYPCDVICRVGSQYGYFPLWLSADIYGAEYSQKQILPDAVLSRTRLDLSYPYLHTAEVLQARLFDMPARTLLLCFTTPLTVLSSLTGWAEGVTTVGNHSSPSLAWAITHHLGLQKTTQRTLALFGVTPENSAFLHTGADVIHMGLSEQAAEGLRVTVLATAGVKGNAMRASLDQGLFVEHGTINQIVLTNRTLSPAAMTRCLITATEAKTAVLEDLDIRSSYTGVAATGTGTDNVLVVSGHGPTASMSGGHTKLGELVARASYAAVRQAVENSNRLFANRDIFQRLTERKAGLSRLEALCSLRNHSIDRRKLCAALESLLCQSRYAGFMAQALALADSHERGLVQDTTTFDTLCLAIASELAGKPVSSLKPIFTETTLPAILLQALNTLATGVLGRQRP